MPTDCKNYPLCKSYARYTVTYRDFRGVTSYKDAPDRTEHLCSDCHYAVMSAHDRHAVTVLQQSIVSVESEA